MTNTKNTAPAEKKQLPIDHKKANELTCKIVAQLRLAVRYAELSAEYDDLFDHFGFDRSVEQFVDFARDISKNLKELRKARGVTD